MPVFAASAISLDATALDYAILAIYFAVVLGIGWVARLSIKTDVDFFLSGRSLPAWITGLAFVAANFTQALVHRVGQRNSAPAGPLSHEREGVLDRLREMARPSGFV